MAGEVATAYVTLLPTFRGGAAAISTQLNPAAATAGVAAGGKLGGGLATGLKGALGPIAAIAGGAAVFGFLSDAEGDATDLNETINKSKTIFGDNFAAIDKWSQDAAKSMGLPREAALNAAAGFGDMFTQLGFLPAQAAALAESTVGLAADLGSFNNLPTEDVAQRISAAFRGEYDSLQLLIPNINAARVQSEALAMTGKTVASELTAQEKAAAVLAIVTKDGARAAGDFAKTSEENANKSKIVSARFQDLQSRIGKGLIPVMGFFLDIGSKILDFFEGGSGAASGFGEVIGKVIGWIKTFISDNMTTFQSWWETLKGIFTSLQELVAVVVAVVVAIWERHGDKIMRFIMQVWSTVKTVIGSALKVIQGIIKVVTGIISGDWSKAWDGIKQIFGAVWDTIKSILSLAWSYITEIIGTALAMVWEIVTTKFGEIVTWLSGLPKRFADAVVGLWDWIWVRAAAIYAMVKLKFESLGAFVAGLPGWLADKAGDIWGWIVTAAREAAAAAWNALLAQFGGGFDPEQYRPPPPEGRGAAPQGGGSSRVFGDQSFGGGRGGGSLIGQIIVNQLPGEPDSRGAKTVSDMAAALVGLQG